jgi:hypothetical protein
MRAGTGRPFTAIRGPPGVVSTATSTSADPMDTNSINSTTAVRHGVLAQNTINRW